MSRQTSPLRGRMIFLVGVRRSGTNWLQRLLTVHPDVVAIPPETHLFSHALRQLQDQVQHGVLTSTATGTVYMERDAFLDATRDFCDAVFGPLAAALGSRAGKVVERTPLHVSHLDLIGDVYPDASIVHIVRDGRDVARSLVSQSWGPSSVTEAADEWVSGIESARAVAPRLQRYTEIRYEDFLTDTLSCLKNLYATLELSVTPEILERALVEAAVPYNVDPTNPGIGERKWQATWSTTERQQFDRVGGELLGTLGYERDPCETFTEPSQADPTRDRSKQVRWGDRLGQMTRSRLLRRRACEQLSPEHAQRRVDTFFAHLESRRYGEAVNMFAADAPVHAVSADQDWVSYGPTGAARLVEMWTSDEAGRGRQIRSEIFHMGHWVMALTTHASSEGRPSDRVYLLRLGSTAIEQVSYYRFPLRS